MERQEFQHEALSPLVFCVIVPISLLSPTWCCCCSDFGAIRECYYCSNAATVPRRRMCTRHFPCQLFPAPAARAAGWTRRTEALRTPAEKEAGKMTFLIESGHLPLPAAMLVGRRGVRTQARPFLPFFRSQHFKLSFLPFLSLKKA